MSISSFPLALLPLSLLLAVLVSRFYATKQTAEQIRQTRHKKDWIFSYSHRKELFSYFEKIGKWHYSGAFEEKYKIYLGLLHKNFFNGTPDDGVPEVNIDAFKRILKETCIQQGLK